MRRPRRSRGSGARAGHAVRSRWAAGSSTGRTAPCAGGSTAASVRDGHARRGPHRGRIAPGRRAALGPATTRGRIGLVHVPGAAASAPGVPRDPADASAGRRYLADRGRPRGAPRDRGVAAHRPRPPTCITDAIASGRQIHAFGSRALPHARRGAVLPGGWSGAASGRSCSRD